MAAPNGTQVSGQIDYLKFIFFFWNASSMQPFLSSFPTLKFLFLTQMEGYKCNNHLYYFNHERYSYARNALANNAVGVSRHNHNIQAVQPRGQKFDSNLKGLNVLKCSTTSPTQQSQSAVLSSCILNGNHKPAILFMNILWCTPTIVRNTDRNKNIYNLFLMNKYRTYACGIYQECIFIFER